MRTVEAVAEEVVAEAEEVVAEVEVEPAVTAGVVVPKAARRLPATEAMALAVLPARCRREARVRAALVIRLRYPDPVEAVSA